MNLLRHRLATDATAGTVPPFGNSFVESIRVGRDHSALKREIFVQRRQSSSICERADPTKQFSIRAHRRVPLAIFATGVYLPRYESSRISVPIRLHGRRFSG